MYARQLGYLADTHKQSFSFFNCYGFIWFTDVWLPLRVLQAFLWHYPDFKGWEKEWEETEASR